MNTVLHGDEKPLQVMAGAFDISESLPVVLMIDIGLEKAISDLCYMHNKEI